MKGMKRLAILGSTGSVGENALRIVRIHPDRFRVDALAVKKSVARLYEQAVEFRPKIVCIYDGVPAGAWLSRFKKLGVRVVTGDKGLEEVATFPSGRWSARWWGRRASNRSLRRSGPGKCSPSRTRNLL